MRDEVLVNKLLSSFGEQDMDTTGCQMSHLDDVEFYWEHERLDVDAVFRPGRDTSFSLSNYKDFEMGSMVENPILIDEEEDKENTPQIIIVSERQKHLQYRYHYFY